MRTVRDVSAGGVVFRRRGRDVEIALVGRTLPERWGLPKGAPARGESLEQAALREVAEETGLHARLISPLAPIQYWFVLHGVRHDKIVHFYLMEAVGGDIADHDHEHDAVGWFALEDAANKISYDSEIRIVALAAETLGRLEKSRFS